MTSSSADPQHSDAQKPSFFTGGADFDGLSLRFLSAITSLGTDINGPWTASHVGGRLIRLGGRDPDLLLWPLLLLLRGATSFCSSISRTPSRCTSVSMLLLSFSGYNWVAGPVDSFAANVSAWSLCCQQKYAAAPISSPLSSPATDVTARTPSPSGSFASIGRLHGRPDCVRPLHVVAGFRESERGISDSGVTPVNMLM